MSKSLTPEQRAAYRNPHMDEMGGAVVSVPFSDLAALLDAADERDRLAADLDALRQRAEQWAALPHHLSDAAALHVATLYAILATPEGAPFRPVAVDMLGVEEGQAAARTNAMGDILTRLWNSNGADKGAAAVEFVNLGRRILAGEG